MARWPLQLRFRQGKAFNLGTQARRDKAGRPLQTRLLRRLAICRPAEDAADAAH